jgi:hypothetical protein
MAKVPGIFKKALRPVAESIWWNRLRLVYWPRITAPFYVWHYNLIIRKNQRLMMARRRHAWQLLQRNDLTPEKEKLARKYYELNQELYELYQEMRRTFEGMKKP